MQNIVSSGSTFPEHFPLYFVFMDWGMGHGIVGHKHSDA